MKPRIRPLAFLAPVLALAHPMGNFSVSHYSRIEVTAPGGAAIRYVLDLAEIPTFELLQQWRMDASGPRAELERHAADQARQWAGNLKIELDGRAVKPQFERASMVLDKGAGGMAILRVIAELRVQGAPGKAAGGCSLRYQDGNFPDRAGWKEIVIVAGAGTVLDRASPAGTDRSHELTAYPQDPLVAPLQDVAAAVSWQSSAPVPTETAAATTGLPPTGGTAGAASKPGGAPEDTAAALLPQAGAAAGAATTTGAALQAPAAATGPLSGATAPATADVAPQGSAATEPLSAGAAAQPGQTAPGMVVRGDYLSKLLHQGEIGWGMMLVGMVVAFGLGSIHALSPGHGKTIVAAYLVGARGTARHALFLGGMVTFTHTITVFFLGLVTLFLSRYVLPERIYPVLGAISGASIVWIGATLLYKRIRVAFGGSGVHFHPHPHGHDHDHHHPHTHEHGGLVHDHGDGHVHSHVPEGDISLGSLVALGASGGLVPCPSALVLLLSSVALGRVGLGLTLLVAFSAGLAVVLSGIGLVVLYAKNLLPDSQKTARHALFRYLPVASAAVIVCAGILMTGVALGVIRPLAGV